ncbi:hypothetical protein BGL45_06525 [Fructilactobacillus sanfranciscensis]|nr:hypothetical protein BGL45_06525 [Fructilactobacillus sanfranciscensis]
MAFDPENKNIKKALQKMKQNSQLILKINLLFLFLKMKRNVLRTIPFHFNLAHAKDLTVWPKNIILSLPPNF